MNGIMGYFWVILVIVGVVMNIVRKAKQIPPKREFPRSRLPEVHTYDEENRQAEVIEEYETAFRSSSRTFRNHAGAPQPSGQAQVRNQAVQVRPTQPNDTERHPLQPTVHVDLTEMHESQHEKLHHIHETVRVRQQQGSESVPESTRSGKPSPLRSVSSFTKADLTRALVLGEVLGEPRSKKPWRPKNRR